MAIDLKSCQIDFIPECKQVATSIVILLAEIGLYSIDSKAIKMMIIYIQRVKSMDCDQIPTKIRQ